jgi:hypothetical protein
VGDGVDGQAPGVTDATLAAFLQGVELAAVALYGQLSATLGSPAATATAGRFVDHHQAHARAFGELAGPLDVPLPPPELVAALQPVAPLSSERDALAFLSALEGRVAATHHFVLGRLTSTPAIALAASTLPVECQHAVVLGTLVSQPLGQLVPTTQGDDAHLVPATLLGP